MAANARIGYARVSTYHQNLDLQRDALAKASCASIYEEKVSGKCVGGERPEWTQCLQALRPGDTLVVWRSARTLVVGYGAPHGGVRTRLFLPIPRQRKISLTFRSKGLSTK